MIRLPTLVALLLSCSFAAADTLAPVLVEAETSDDSADAQVGDVVLQEYTGSHTRIEAKQLLEAGASLGQLLAVEAGVQNRQSGAVGSYSSISVRGSSAAQTPIYWDGLLLNGAANPGVDLSDLELLNLGSVTIYRGSTPAQLGTGGMAGAVELRSPSTPDEHLSVRLQTGSFDDLGLQLGASSSGQRWKTSGVASVRRADNDFEFLNNNGTPLNTADDRHERRHNAQFERSSLLGKLSYQLSERHQLDARVQFSQRAQGVPSWRNRVDNQASYETETGLLQLNLRSQSLRGSDWNSRVGVYQLRRAQRFDDRLRQIGLSAQLQQSDVNTAGLSAYAEHIGDAGTLAMHLDARHEVYNNDDLLGSEHSEARRNSTELNLQYSRFSADERWLWTPALHIKSLKDRYTGQLVGASPEQSIDNAALQLGLRYQSSASLSWQANLGQHHREPSFDELFGNQGLHIGNDELKAEKGLNIDLATIKTWEKGQLQLGVFYNRRDQLITEVYNAQGIGRSENIGSAEIRGLELSIERDLPYGMAVRANLSLQDAVNKSQRSALSSNQLPGLARTDAYLRLLKKRRNTSMWYEAKALAGRYFDTANLLKAEDYLSHNLGVSWTSENWSLSAVADNISDERSEDFNGYVKPGRSFHLSIQHQIKSPIL